MAGRTRTEWLVTFLLVPSIVIAVLLLTSLTFQTNLKQEHLRQRSVLEATLFAANERAARLDQLIVNQDNVVVSEADISDLATFGENWLKVAPRETPTVRAVVIVDLTSPMQEVVGFASRRPGPEDDQFRRLLINSTLSDSNLASPIEELRHLHKSYRDKNYLLSYWQREKEGRRYLVVAWHDVPRVVHELVPKLYRERDEQSLMNIVDEDGGIVFGPPLRGGDVTVGRPFQTTLYKWRLNVLLLSADEFASNASRKRILEMALAGLSGLVVMAGLIVVLVAAARERKLSDLKSEFVANVSHELKTPLALVRMFGELLQSGRVENDEKRAQYLQIIVSEAERLGALIENVLDFAKVERGKAAYEFSDGNVGEVVARAVEACRVRADRETVKLELAVATGLPGARLDERAVEIAVLNLIDNAFKYAVDGRRVRVDVRKNGNRLEISVADEGPGIAAEDRKRIFERFVRGKGTKQVRGSGIGLALVKHIALAHGGDAWVEPAEKLGSRFVFTIKLDRRANSVIAVPAQ